MDYLQLYIYRIRKAQRNEFLETMRKARDIYRKHGARGEELFVLHDKMSKYGLTGLWEVLSTKEDEEIWIGLDRYDSLEHCSKVIERVDADPEIDPLYEQIVRLVGSTPRIIRAEFEMADY